MDRMLFVAMSGATETMLAQANNNNNMANANTPGFLQDLNQFRSMPVYGDGQPTRVYAMNERPATNFVKGQMQQTGNDLDIIRVGSQCRHLMAVRLTPAEVISRLMRMAF